MIFSSPQEIATEVFAEVPSAHRRSTPMPERVAAGRTPPKGGVHMEGPSFDRDGNLYFVDNAYGRIFRADPKGAVELVIEYDGEPNGLRIHRDGRIFVADYQRGIMLLDPAKGEVTPVVSRYNTSHFIGVNDLIFSRSGDLYFTDQGQSDLRDPCGRVYCLKSSGELRCITDGLPSPNGLALNHKEDVLHVAVTRANAVWKVPMTPSGAVSRMGTFIQLSGGVGPDGMAVLESGGLAVAHPGLGAVWIFDEHGEPQYRVRSCAGRHTTNVAFGGPDMRTLYVTEAETGVVLKAELPVAGVRLYSHS